MQRDKAILIKTR